MDGGILLPPHPEPFEPFFFFFLATYGVCKSTHLIVPCQCGFHRNMGQQEFHMMGLINTANNDNNMIVSMRLTVPDAGLSPLHVFTHLNLTTLIKSVSK